MIFILLSMYSSISCTIPDTLLVKSIVIVESQESANAKNVNSNGTVDYGLGQINTIWVNSLNLDTLKLLDDEDYNLYWTGYILRHYLDKYGWTWKGLSHYHSSNPIHSLSYMLEVKEVYDSLNTTNSRSCFSSLKSYSDKKQRAEGTTFRIIDCR